MESKPPRRHCDRVGGAKRRTGACRQSDPWIPLHSLQVSGYYQAPLLFLLCCRVTTPRLKWMEKLPTKLRREANLGAILCSCRRGCQNLKLSATRSGAGNEEELRLLPPACNLEVRGGCRRPDRSRRWNIRKGDRRGRAIGHFDATVSMGGEEGVCGKQALFIATISSTRGGQRTHGDLMPNKDRILLGKRSIAIPDLQGGATSPNP